MQLVTATSRINGRLSRRARPAAAALIRAYDGKPGKAKGYFLTLGREDLTFALTRIEPKACASFKAVTE